MKRIIQKNRWRKWYTVLSSLILGAALLVTACTPSGEALINPPKAGVDPTGLSSDEIAYLTLLFSRAGLPFDLSNIPPDTDGDAIPNIVDPDVDGDGVPNEDDPDIDGDGQPNTQDADVDGDGFDNDFDLDIDADGIANDDDFDADADSLSDRFDLNDDGDDEPDDEDPDDRHDKPKTGLEDLADRLKRGLLSNSDKDRIVQEITKRLNSNDLKLQLGNALVSLIVEATSPDRLARPLTVPAGIDALDQLYEQLDEAIKEAKRGQFDPDGPFQNRARERKAAEDMVLRAQTMATMARAFPTMLIDDINESTKKLRSDMGSERLLEFSQGLGDHVSPIAIGSVAAEKRELDALTKGGSVIGSAFRDADVDGIYDGIDRLRARAADTSANPLESSSAKYDRMLNRLAEIKSQSSSSSLDDAVTQVEAEN